jgi:hypothetical protein
LFLESAVQSVLPKFYVHTDRSNALSPTHNGAFCEASHTVFSYKLLQWFQEMIEMRLAWFEWFLTALGVGLLALFIERGQALDALVGLVLIGYGSSRLEPWVALRRLLSRLLTLLRPASLVGRPARLVQRLSARVSSQG